MNKKDLKIQRDKSRKELEKLVVKKKLKYIEEHANLKAGGEKSPKKIRELKRDIARILTIIREKQLSEQESRREGEKE